jgi:hypothetical protein
VVAPFDPICNGDAELDLVVSGIGQASLEGAMVWVAAAEPEQGPTPGPDPIVARLATTVAGGAFEVSCVTGLTENYVYPSIGVVADADGDGECGDDDLAFTIQLFGWEWDQVYIVEGDALVAVGDGEPWVMSHQAWHTVAEVGEVWGKSFCDYYFASAED